MRTLKVMTVVGTRPEIIRLSRVLAALDSSPSIEHTLVHTGQNYDYELNAIFFEELELRRPNYFLEAAGDSPSKTIGQIIIKIDEVLERVKPDAFLVLGDTNSCLCAIPAKKKHIPIFHMEAGNRCFDQRVPEETNRKIVDHISDINLTYSSIAREYLLREGLSPDRVIKTGSPMFEVLNYYSHSIRASQILKKLSLKKSQYFVVSCHREENVNVHSNFSNLLKVLNTIAETYKLPIIFSTHPRTRKMIDKTKEETHPMIKFLKPLGFFDYNALQLNALAVLSDSGTISEEASILGFDAINIREAHERPEAMEEGTVIMSGLNNDRILQALSHIKVSKQIKQKARIVQDYTSPDVSNKVVKIIISYTDYIKRLVWSE